VVAERAAWRAEARGRWLRKLLSHNVAVGRAAKHRLHNATVGRLTPSAWATPLLVALGAAQAITIRARTASACAVLRRRVRPCTSRAARSAAVGAIGTACGLGIGASGPHGPSTNARTLLPAQPGWQEFFNSRH
jgi:hypothetical protein